MKTIRLWLEEEAGVSLSITSLTSYVSRIRRRESVHSGRCQTARQIQPDKSAGKPNRSSGPSDTVPHDPLASAVEMLRQRRFDIREVHGDGDPTDKNLI